MQGLLQGAVVPAGCIVCHARGCDFTFSFSEVLSTAVSHLQYVHACMHVYACIRYICICKSNWASLEKRLKSKRVSNNV